jgi:hypothetical protein
MPRRRRLLAPPRRRRRGKLFGRAATKAWPHGTKLGKTGCPALMLALALMVGLTYLAIRALYA